MAHSHPDPLRARAPRLALGLAVVACLAATATAAPAWASGVRDPVMTGLPPAPAVAARSDGPVLEVCPVDAPRRFIDDFGQPRYAGGYHHHQGIDIFAAWRTPIRAPFDGVAKSSVSWAGGLQLTIQGSRGFVFNAHLTAFGKTGKVEAGDVVGYVGNTGDARGGSTHDHFEWHPKNGPAVDAYGLLRQACRAVPHRTRPPAEPRRMA